MLFVIPSELVQNYNLSTTDAILYYIIDVFDVHGNGGCCLPNRDMVKLMGKTISTVNNGIQKLKRLELIYDNGKNNAGRMMGIVSKIKDPAYIRIKEQSYKKLSKLVHYKPIECEILFKKTERKYSLIEFWNTLPNTRKHKQGTKTYAETIMRLQQLRRGTLHNNKFNKDWRQKHNIFDSTLQRKHSPADIKSGLKRLSMMLTPGYWPEDKSWVKKMGLKDLIYNPRTMNSWFLSVMINKPELLSNKLNKIEPELFKHLKQLFKSPQTLITVKNNIKYLYRFYNSIPTTIKDYGDFSDFCYTREQFCIHYINWIQRQDWITDYSPSLFKVNGKLFKRYLMEVWKSDNLIKYL